MNEPVLLVLAAGMGSRYGGLKQMEPMSGSGQSLLDYSVYDARAAGFRRIIFLIKKEMEGDFRARTGDRIARCMDVDYAFQRLEDLPAGFSVPPGREKPWGTVHAVLAARHLLSGPFAVINADDYYGPAAYRLVYDRLVASREPGRYVMVGYRVGDTLSDHGGVTRGLCACTPEGVLSEIRERTGIERNGPHARYSVDGGKSWVHVPGDTPVSMNFWGFRQDFLELAEQAFPTCLEQIMSVNPLRGECYLPMLVGGLIREKRARVDVLFSPDRWFGVTYRQDKAAVSRSLAALTAEGVYPEDLWGR